MTLAKPTTDYWTHKFLAYMHDPLDKVIHIPGHENRAARMLDPFGLQWPNEADPIRKKADAIASGFDRGQVPTHSSDSNKSGSVNFFDDPILTHPTGQKAHLTIQWPTELLGLDSQAAADHITGKVSAKLKEWIGTEPGEGGLYERFAGNQAAFARARFFYAHLALRFKLAEENIAGLGGLWHRLPADSRFPDHSIWQHNGLTSALFSCMDPTGEGKQNKVGLMVFSITPVQGFIARARKLRDYWVGSMLLSWLAFEGIRWVMEHLGPDHVIYPSLIDQPLVTEYLRTEWQIKDGRDSFMPDSMAKKHEIASFPNKFLFLIPMEQAKEIGASVQNHINQQWRNLSETCSLNLMEKLAITDPSSQESIHWIFTRQNKDYWELQWAASELLDRNNEDEWDQLFAPEITKGPKALLDKFLTMLEKFPHYEKSGKGVLYPLTHALTQSALAATKLDRPIAGRKEPGEKCPLCGEFEVVHDFTQAGKTSAADYKEAIRAFWEEIRHAYRDHTFNKNEKLCSLCLIKRIAPLVLEKSAHIPHILHQAFKKTEGFPSTTEIALTQWFEKHGIFEKSERRIIAQSLHDQDDLTEDKNPVGKVFSSKDRYYAILMMDGDKMGKLVNGETLASRWETGMHPKIVERLKQEGFDKTYRDLWKGIYKNLPVRQLTPSIHAAISESLGDFALYGVAGIIEDHSGRLIYAGGDDVCAVLPVHTVLNAARATNAYYAENFQWIAQGASPEPIEAPNQVYPRTGKLSVNLGKGGDISISAAILVCHHKESLGGMLREAHRLLDKESKEKMDRAACTIALRKRSGGTRMFRAKWADEGRWKAFESISRRLLAAKDKQQGFETAAALSTSLAYRLERMRTGIEAVVSVGNDTGRMDEITTRFFAAQLKRSGVNLSLRTGEESKDDMQRAGHDIAALTLVKQGEKTVFTHEALIVAGFMADNFEAIEPEGGRHE